MGLTGLPGHEVKVTSDKQMIFTFHQKNKGGNRDYCSHFSVIPETTSKSPFFFKIVIWKCGG